MTGPRRAAVLGRPIAHSLSPALHTAAYTALGLDWEFSAVECGVDELPRVLAERAGWAGFCCTMPLKRAVLAIADEASALARAVGAANTLTPRAGGGWRADNTDVAGIVAALRESAVDPHRVTVLGAGGTAQAAVGALAELGVRECAVLVRNPDRTAELRATAETLGVTVRVGALRHDAAELGADLVISTLPRGAADPLARHAWRAAQAVLDVVYDPWPTELASAVARSGGMALSGGLMLLHQAAVQVALMTGRPAPLEAMRAALRAVAPASGV